MERQFDKAQKKAQGKQLQVVSTTEAVLSGSEKSISLPQPMADHLQGWSSHGARQQQQYPFGGPHNVLLPVPDVTASELYVAPPTRRLGLEATFIPTAAGLRSGEGQCTGLSLDIHSLFAEVISKAMAMGPTRQSVPPSVIQSTAPGSAKSNARISLSTGFYP